MNIRQDVIDALDELGRPASGDDLLPHLPDYTRDQVFQALQNAKWDKKVVIVEPSKALGKGKGRTPATYAIAEVAPAPAPSSKSLSEWVDRPVNSVFELGTRAQP